MENEDIIDLKRLYFILRRRIKIIAGSALVTLTFAGIYLYTTPALYTAQTTILLDKSATKAISNVSSINSTTFEPAAIDSEVEIIRSKRITDTVAKILSDQPYITNILNQDNGDYKLYNHLRSNLSVGRLGATYTLSIRYTSQDPQQSADIANAFAEAYIDEQLDSLSETSQKTLDWLEEKSEEIKTTLNETRDELQEKRQIYNRQARSGKKKNEAEVTLEEIKNLEKETETYNTIYESYLEKIRIIGLEQSFPVTETRVITSASAPLSKSHPNEKIIVLAALILGAGFGVIISLIIDLFDKSIRRAGQVKQDLQTEFLGFFPKLESKITTSVKFTDTHNQNISIPMNIQAINGQDALCTETSVIIKNALDKVDNGDAKGKIIGIVSTFSEQSNDFVASNLGFTCAQSGRSAILVDGDIYDASRFPKAQKSNKNFQLSPDAVLRSDEYNLDLLTHKHSNMLKDHSITQDDLADLIAQLRQEYDYTVIDLPPLHDCANFSSYVEHIDQFVLVARWGKNVPNSVNFYLDLNKVPRERICGMVLTETNMKKMKRHFGHQTFTKSPASS